MFKTFSINLAGQIFHINEDAFDKLSAYLKSLKEIYQNEEGGDEIMKDIEARISEIILHENNSSNVVITSEQVDRIIQALGSPEQHAIENDEADNNKNTHQKQDAKTRKKLFRDGQNKVISGVCSGLSYFLGINDPIWIRLLFIVSLFLGLGSSLLIYVALIILIPEAKTSTEKLQMKGEPINIENIERTIKDSFQKVSDSLNNTDTQSIKDSLGSTVASILKFAFALVKGALLIALIFIIFILVMLLFASGVSSLALAPMAAKFIFGSKLISYMTIAAIVVFFVVSALFLILLPFQLFSTTKKPFKNKKGITLGSLWLLSLIVLFVGSIFALRQFKVEEKITKEQILTVSDTTNTPIYISSLDYANNTSGDNSLSNIYWNRWRVTENGFINGMVKLNIAQSPDQNIHLFETMGARGQNKSDAIANIKNIDYQYIYRGDSLLFNNYLTTKQKNSKFRAQQVEITLYLPQGKPIIFDNVEKIINKKPRVKNVDYDSDYNLQNNIWMLQNGYLEPISPTQTQDASSQWTDVTPTASFSDISIEGFVQAEVIHAQYPKVLVENPNAFRIKVDGNELDIESKNSFQINPDVNQYKIKIYTPNLIELSTSGLTSTTVSGFNQSNLIVEVEGNSSADLQGNQLANARIKLDGNSKLSGSSAFDQLFLKMEGISKLEGINLDISQLNLNMDGSSKAEVHVTKSIQGQMNGISSLTYSGTPRVDIKTTGAASIHQSN